MLVAYRAFAPIVCLGLTLGCALLSGIGCSGSANPASMPARSPVDRSMLVRGEQDEVQESNKLDFNTEAYDELPENRFVSALDQPQSTFAIDVDTAAYSNLRRLLRAGQLPPKGAVRLEELVNYFPYAYPEPSGEHPLDVYVQAAPCPWHPGHQLVRVAMKGQSISSRDRAAANLVFLVDVSGSMDADNKLPYVQQALRTLVKELNEQDRVAIVVYAGNAGCVLPSTSAANATDILAAIEDMRAGGSTNGAAGIQQAYRIAEENFVDGGINRVILCSDGDFNVGVTSQSDLVDLITEKARANVFLTVLGFGIGNLKDSMMEKLADRGNGNYAYIDSLMEARKVLSQELGATLNTIAKDVKIQVDFNPNLVGSYRLLGYENRLMSNAEFRDDNRDAGELGAGHTVTAFYEIVPPGVESPANVRSSEFVTTQTNTDRETLLTVNLRYKHPASIMATEFQRRLPASDTPEADSDFQFASAVLGYGMLLRKSEFKGDLNWDWVLETAGAHLGSDRMGLRHEFINLARKAQRLQAIGQKD